MAVSMAMDGGGGGVHAAAHAHDAGHAVANGKVVMAGDASVFSIAPLALALAID